MATALFVHAHPDDESIATGGSLAALKAAGHRVVVLTATRGEGGEVIGPLQESLEGDRAALAAYREKELAAAMRELGGIEQRVLGDGVQGGAHGGLPARRFEDSGMVWGADGLAQPDPETPAAALAAAETGVPAAYIAEVILQLRPDVLVTYNSGGGYGHPDHRTVHRETLRAVEIADVRGWRVPAVYLVDTPSAVSDARFDPRRPGFAETGFRPAGAVPAVAPDGPPAVIMDIGAHREAKSRAMAAHATQVVVRGEFFALSNGVGEYLDTREYYSAWRRPEGTHDAVARSLVPDTAPQHDPARRKHPLLSWASGIVLGMIVGVMGSMHHLQAVDLGALLPVLTGQILPWGLVLSGLLALSAQIAVGTWSRSVGAIMLSGMAASLVSFLLSMPGVAPGGDLVITGLARSIVWIYLPLVTAIVVTFFLPRLWLTPAPRERAGTSRR